MVVADIQMELSANQDPASVLGYAQGGTGNAGRHPGQEVSRPRFEPATTVTPGNYHIRQVRSREEFWDPLGYAYRYFNNDSRIDDIAVLAITETPERIFEELPIDGFAKWVLYREDRARKLWVANTISASDRGATAFQKVFDRVRITQGHHTQVRPRFDSGL
ncbi:hypothetical protein BDZ89DRAFT_273482 [Hymenopellis radicata]|nr:hypothetical protein BDZ89DRAFT_273482 [Hymenopellis radicata]